MKTNRTYISLLCSILLLCTSALYAAEYTVNPGLSIQTAINNATSGDTIYVNPGIYYEHINLNGKGVTLTSIDPTDPNIVAATVIDGTNNGRVILCNTGEGPATVVTGFKITKVMQATVAGCIVKTAARR